MSSEDAIDSASDIAIIGFAARFPGAENCAQFWENLSRGVESIRMFTVKELESVGVGRSTLRDPEYVRAGAPLSHPEAFDAQFFGISPREAAIMDPQQRVFMESAWEALEHAGYAPGTFSGSTGVFAGSGPNSYLIQNLLSDPELVEKEGIFLLRHTGNDKDVLATRVSYQMNLHGPSVNIQTACSTSLVAIHYACQNLLHFGCDLALAGAVSIEIPHAIGYQYRQNEIQSHDGHCRAFDANATGTVFGSGIGIVVLRRLDEAVEAGDTIHAVIKGTAVNNDGNRKVGFLAPSTEGQVEVIQEALGAAGVAPGSIDYVETHGTGTPIGDPIELSALGQAYANRARPLQIGSVKTNIGHLDTAAGMAGLLKTVLALSNKKIPPTLHFKKLNPLIDSSQTGIEVVDKLIDWETFQGPRRAGVTSLGIGGTNAHVILEEAPAAEPSQPSRPIQLLTFSAKSPAALEEATQAFASHLRRFPNESLSDAAHTLHVGRVEFAHRRIFVAQDHAEALQRAEQPHAAAVVTGKAGDTPAVAFLFSGQGPQYCGMGQKLYQTEPVFRKWIDTCALLAQAHLGFDFRAILYPPETGADEAAQQIKLTWNAQPILFAVEYALAQLWMSWGVRPAKLIGHSLGEYPAACLSGIFSLEDAVSLVCARGNLMKKVSEGAMLAVFQSEAEMAGWITDSLSLAAVNAPDQCVISGPTDAIAALMKQLKGKGVACQKLETSHAFHSSAIEPILDAFVHLVSQKRINAPQIPLISNVTGTWLTKTEATDPAYWARHFRQTVRFDDGLKTLHSDFTGFSIEIGPGETLCALARHSGAKENWQRTFPSMPRPSEKNSDLSTLFFAVGNLWVDGIAIDWQAFHAHERLRRIPLPTYPFQRKKFWMGPKIGTNWLADSTPQVKNWFYRLGWKPAPLPSAAPSAGPWLVLIDPSPESSALMAELRRQKATIITVTSGEKFSSPDENSYVMNLSSEEDYAQLFDQLAQRKQAPRQIVHLWGLHPATPAKDRCFHSLLFLLQKLGRQFPDQNVTVTAVSHRSFSRHHEPVLHPYGSLLSGPCRVAPLEYPLLRCRQLDVDTTEPAALAQMLLGEGENDTPFNLTLYREGSRWVNDVERFQLEAGPDRLREKGTYLITGGLGGLGLAVADWLARTYQARLVLLSRHGDPHDPAHQGQFEQWRKSGAEVLVLAADVTDRTSLGDALSMAREKFGKFNGIIHAAGVLQDGIIQLKKREVAHRVLAPKTVGIELLDELTRDQTLDFFALFSSVSALTPPDGQVDYCAANAFLHAYAQSRPTERNFIVIGWAAWSETGMVAPKRESAAALFHHPLLERVELDTAERTIYSGTLSVERHWVLSDHRFQGGDSLLPGTAHLEIALTALWKKIGRQPVTLENVVFLAPLKVSPNEPCEVQAELRKAGTGYQFSVKSGAVVFVSGQGQPSPGKAPRIRLREIASRCPEKREAPKNVRQRGHFDFGPRWESLRQVAFGPGECLGTVELPAEFLAESRDFVLHPALLDICTGVAMYLVPGYDKPGDILLPFIYKKLTVYAPLPSRVYSHARMRQDNGSDLLVFDLTLADESGGVIAEIQEFTVKRLSGVTELARMEGISPSDNAETGFSGAQLSGIPTREGLEAFQRLLKSRSSDLVFVSPTSLAPVAPMRENAPLTDSVTTASDNVEVVLAQIWQRLLGLDQVDARTDFFDSGGHSLLAVRLFTEIRKRFNIDFGLSTLFEARTIGALAELIRKTREANPSQKTVAVTSGLVPIRASAGANTPLFLIHDVGGSSLRYEHLSRHLPSNQTIYAIEARGLSGLPVDYTVEEMARHYTAQIREQQPHGPYYVVGHSFGGLVTYEIARQMAVLGEPMGLVGLLDTFQVSVTNEDAELQSEPIKAGKLPLFQRLAKDIRAVVWGQDRIGYLQERQTYLKAWLQKTIYRSAYKFTAKYGRRMPSFLKDVKEANWIASDHFVPKPYEGTVVLFRCLNRIDSDPPDSTRVWQRLAREVVIREVPGDHNSILKEPGVRILAEQIESYLKGADPAPAENTTR